MDFVVDTSAVLAVALNEPEKSWLVEVTQGQDLVAPSVLPFEIGNALSALCKRKLLKPDQVSKAWDVTSRIPVELVEVDARSALLLAVKRNIYAYDGYFLECAIQTGRPLLTLDRGMTRVAQALKIRLVEPS